MATFKWDGVPGIGQILQKHVKQAQNKEDWPEVMKIQQGLDRCSEYEVYRTAMAEAHTVTEKLLIFQLACM